VPGNVGTVPFSQITKLVPKLKPGVMLGLTVTVKVAGKAHCPAVGVNVYVPLPVLLTVAGFHVPVIPFCEVPGKVGTDAPLQILRLVPKLNVGVTFGLTVTSNVVGKAHWPAVGVNVYVPLLVLLTVVGLHVPVIPFCDVVGRPGTASPEQIVRLVPKLNVGGIFGFTVTTNVVGKAHNPAVGVNV